jgi:hypothetical protein
MVVFATIQADRSIRVSQVRLLQEADARNRNATEDAPRLSINV